MIKFFLDIIIYLFRNVAECFVKHIRATVAPDKTVAKQCRG